MKKIRFALTSIVAMGVLIGLSSSALARSHVSVGIGIGYPGFYGAYYSGPYRHPYNYRYWGPGGGWRHYPYWGPVIVGGGYWYDPWPDYYVDAPPTVIEKAPVVIERKTVFAQPQGVNENTFKDLRYKKTELLTMLETGDKVHRNKAIKELAGFSFDDNVRQALENVLLSDPDAELRIEAAQALGEVKNVKALPALEKARVEDSSQDVRKEADQAIRKIEETVS